MKIKFTAILQLLFMVSAITAQSPQYKNSESPAGVLSTYYDAVNQKDFRRAYGYWKSPKETYDNFVKGYSQTENVRLIVELPTLIEGAAGSLYAQVPTVLITTTKNQEEQIFSGCYTLHKSNLQPPDVPKEDFWHIYRAELKPAPAEMKVPEMLSKSCDQRILTNDSGSARVPGVFTSESGQMSDSVKVPKNIKANKDFKITVATSGNGCVTAGETEVVLSEKAADIFVYDHTRAIRPGMVCTMIFKTFQHTATLRFAEPGEALIRVWGRKKGGDSFFGEPFVVEKRVTVK